MTVVAMDERAVGAALDARAESELLGLTLRQYEVLVLLARDYPVETVARHLDIAVSAAAAHIKAVYRLLNAHNRDAAVYAALSLGTRLGRCN
jgi:DNA-binding CsgD family transcriptional regulator